ncbi:glutamyl-Q tRNA(Asp) synthetase [Pararhizobium capsulatum DSM 1112]|uniref:Glutamyl-Q tRNA(Asp) synthetase n=1 Tax=Pararhizobium capsulatum DSM 1112 TaxID=1121113 RepID=A0ABU0BV63_9HYPH|nr:tRNA glutamyl-Q(34) synthetase GluQRS [Pararhizobium capsulatum]MDQ0321609.1 glutamyl-Q tRNA(Asp) synthetase [Pararhizobium capsulatum DSM 1112]
MPEILSKPPVFRFAPSPNGLLHLGHALSALINHDMATQSGGRFLLRIEDIDTARCRPEFEAAIYEDLTWLGLGWEKPVRRQSDHFAFYAKRLKQLIERELAYPSFLSRSEIKAAVAEKETSGRAWPRDPDGAPHYPGDERHWNASERAKMLATGGQHAWRLDMRKALGEIEGPLFWQETGAGPDSETEVVSADPAEWGDIVLSRSDAPSSYHLSVTLDDALQGITHVVRGQDLFHATSVHRLLQRLLDLPEPVYHHHRLILDAAGKKLSKSDGATGLAAYRAAGHSAADIRALLL